MTTRQELDSFQRFAAERLSQPDCAATLDELFTQWHDAQSREEIDQAIERGLADVDAGRFQPASTVTQALAKRFGISKE